ncbi:hypothetical protein AcW1_007462 [Taiwanofungus camphoratus]|nr:hypothetical protein AcW2_007481 [Antrodia cinnamomea]KAI0953169.1 hypothetical protein AcW1_007462 [Antrodia cinnamomea]
MSYSPLHAWTHLGDHDYSQYDFTPSSDHRLSEGDQHLSPTDSSTLPSACLLDTRTLTALKPTFLPDSSWPRPKPASNIPPPSSTFNDIAFKPTSSSICDDLYLPQLPGDREFLITNPSFDIQFPSDPHFLDGPVNIHTGLIDPPSSVVDSPLLLQDVNQTCCDPSKAEIPLSNAINDDSDADAEGESEGDATEDSEYVPSPRVSPARRRHVRRATARKQRPSPYAHASPASTPPLSPASSRSPSSGASPRSPRAGPRPRNIQAPLLFEVATAAAKDSFACPQCPYVQLNRRRPDLTRHIATHFSSADPGKWTCCGVPVERAAEYGVTDISNPYVYEGQLMVGGCQKTFSRRDALKRHLDNDNISCIGDVNAPYLRGNQ